LSGLAMPGWSANSKVLRDNESEADRLGLLMMAQSGVHPDFALLLFRRLEQKTGDESRLAALFSSDHARWATREIRTMTTYRDALRDFQYRWSDKATSPGGAPSAVADYALIDVTPDAERDT